MPTLPSPYIISPWSAVTIQRDALRQALIAHGQVSDATARNYVTLLATLLPHANTLEFLTRALYQPIPNARFPSTSLNAYKSRRAAWRLFLKVAARVPGWRDVKWPPVPAPRERKARRKYRRFDTWLNSRTVPIPIAWLCRRSVHMLDPSGRPLSPVDFRTVTASAIHVEGTSAWLEVYRAKTYAFERAQHAGAVRLYLDAADKVMLFVLQLACLGQDFGKIPASRRRLISRGGYDLAPAEMAAVAKGSTAKLLDPRVLCPSPLAARVLGEILLAAAIEVVPDPHAGMDLWGKALMAALARYAWNETTGLDGARALRVLHAWMSLERPTLVPIPAADVELVERDPAYTAAVQVGLRVSEEGLKARREKEARGESVRRKPLVRAEPVEPAEGETRAEVPAPPATPAAVLPPPRPAIAGAPQSEFIQRILRQREEYTHPTWRNVDDDQRDDLEEESAVPPAKKRKRRQIGDK